MKHKYREYYAAANGFSGFRSYFSELFSPEKFKGIFILKGGPGTGKSSFMRKILHSFLEKGFACDAIYCSSDPRSLDGVIIDEKVAILDGTATHEMDTRLPGALDEIINLGESWDSDLLKNNRRKIEEINKIKKYNYNSAYKYLSFLGNVHNFKNLIWQKQFDFVRAQNLISTLTSCFKKESVCEEKLLLSSFSKDGLVRREIHGFDIEKVYSVNGIIGEEEIFMNCLYRQIKGEFPIIHIPSPLSDDITEGVYFIKEKTLLITNAEYGEIINTTAFLNQYQDAEIEFLNKVENAYIEKSKEYFEKASGAHFLLEDIYKNAMDFTKNEEIYRKICDKLMKILSY